MKLRNAILAGLMFGMAHGSVQAGEDKITKGYNSMDAMGCMLLRECTDNVEEVFSLLDISSQYEKPERYTFAATEFNRLLVTLHQIGVKVYLADQKYFPIGHRGVYHTVSNNFYLNRRYMHDPAVLMQLMRHEGWHAAQDCMAGSIKNNFIAIIMNEEDVPKMYQAIAKSAYSSTPSAIPWEKEAYWAGHTEGMTEKALKSCAAGTMWSDYKPTPLTYKWLKENNYVD